MARSPGPPTLWRPTPKDLAAARGKRVADVIAPALKVLFCGINPGLYSAAIGHHFGKPGNRFWPALHRACFTARLLSPYEERELLPLGYGISNIVDRATGSADELSAEELQAGAVALGRKLRRYRPRWIAFLGLTAYRTAFSRPEARIGRQEETFEDTGIWLLPNPSGLNAHYDLAGLARLFAELRRATERWQ
jgi:TDG/mug DNA glycosylase family protein